MPSHGGAYTGWKTAYVAPSDQVTESITSPTVAEFTFTDTDHEPDFIGTSGIKLVRRYEIIGDVNGELQARGYANIAEGPSGNYSTYDGWSDWTTLSSGLIPDGKRIKRILSPTSSIFGHIRTSDAAAFAFLGRDPVDGVVVLFEDDSLYMEVRFAEIDVELEDIGG